MKLSVEDNEKEPEQSNSLKEFTIDEIQDAIDRLKKGKRETAMEYEPNSSKIAVMRQKKKSGQSSTTLHSKKNSHQKAGVKSEYK